MLHLVHEFGLQKSIKLYGELQKSAGLEQQVGCIRRMRFHADDTRPLRRSWKSWG